MIWKPNFVKIEENLNLVGFSESGMIFVVTLVSIYFCTALASEFLSNKVLIRMDKIKNDRRIK